MPWRSKMLVSALALAALTDGAAAYPSSEVAAIVARSLSYDQALAKTKHYSVTDEWRNIAGQTMICVRPDIPNGAGGYAPTTDYSMFAISNGVILAVTKDNSLFGCPNRSYEPLRPLERGQAK